MFVQFISDNFIAICLNMQISMVIAYHHGQAFAPLFCSGGASPPQILFWGGGFSRSNFNPKNHNFSDDLFWYIHIMLLH